MGTDVIAALVVLLYVWLAVLPGLLIPGALVMGAMLYAQPPV